MTTEVAPELDLDAVVAPFRSLDPGLCLAIEGADGTPIASTSLAYPAGDAVTREILAGALVGGRIRVWGAASADGLGAAVAESLAALEALADMGLWPGPRDPASEREVREVRRRWARIQRRARASRQR